MENQYQQMIVIVVGDSPMTQIMDLSKENIYQELSW